MLPSSGGTAASTHMFRSCDGLPPLCCYRGIACRLFAGRDALGRSPHCIGRIDRLERRAGGCAERLLQLPRTAWRGRRRRHSASCRTRYGLPAPPTRSLCRRPPASLADGLDRTANGAPRKGARVGLLRLFAVARTRYASAFYSEPVSVRRSPARNHRLRDLSWCPWRRERSGVSAAGRAAQRLPCPADRCLAAFQAPHRSRRHDAPDQPASDSLGKRGSRGLCCDSPRGSLQSGISGNIPRSTSCRSQK